MQLKLLQNAVGLMPKVASNHHRRMNTQVDKMPSCEHAAKKSGTYNINAGKV